MAAFDLLLYRSELREHLGYGDENALADSSRTVKNADGDLLLNRSFWEILNKFPFREKEQSSTFLTVAGTSAYNLPTSAEAIRQISVKELDTGKWITLDRDSLLLSEDNRNDDTDARGKPTHAFTENLSLRLRPIPDDVYTVRVQHWVTLADLSDGNLDPGLPSNWKEIILFGGVYRGFIRLQDFNKAQAMRSHQLTLIDSSVPVESKEEMNSPRAGVDLPSELTEI